MRQIAHYAVLKYQPYPNRTEHVNYGLIAFMPEGGVRVYLAAKLRKVKAMFPMADVRSLLEQEETIPELVADAPLADAVDLLNAVSVLNDQTVETLGKFEYADAAEFTRHIQLALRSQVEASTPPRKARENRSRLYSDVRTTFKDLGILAPAGESIPDHQVVEHYSPDPEADVKVEFALQNGLLRLAQTIDLRGDSAGIPKSVKTSAYSKAFAMDYAARVLESSALETYVIVAGTEGDAAKKVMAALDKSPSRVLAWESKTDMMLFFDEWAKATGKPAQAITQ